MEAAAASAMDFHALSRRELQALCKRNGVRANMTNAAMADALQGLTSVDGIDEIGTTLCLPTPGRSAMKSGAKAAAFAGEDQQQGSPLPRGRRVSVMSPAAIRMDIVEGDDELKQDLVKEIIKTPGVALRSTSRRARATPAPLPTSGTLRRSTRTAARKATAPVEADNLVEEVSTVKRTTRKPSARSKMMVDLDEEGEVAAAAPKVQQEEPKAVTSDVKCDDPKEVEEEVTKILEGDNKEEKPEEGEKADSFDAVNGSALVLDKSCVDLKMEEAAAAVEQEASKPREGTVEEHEPISEEKSAPLEPMEDSPIFGVLSKAETTELVIEKTQAAVENEVSPVNEITDEIDPAVEDDEGVDAGLPVNEITDEIDSAVEDDEGVDAGSPVNEMTDEINPAVEDKADAVAEEVDEEILPSAEISEKKEGEAELTEDGISEEEDEDEEWSSDDETSEEEVDFTDESDEESDETNEEADCSEMRTDFNNVESKLVQKMQNTAIAQKAIEDDSAEEEVSEDGSAEEEASGDGSAEEEASEDGPAEDDFTSDLPPEFDNIVVSIAETESVNTPPVLKENQVAAVSATKTAVKSLNESAISLANEEEGSKQGDVREEVANTVDTLVKSLDDFTIKEVTHQAEENTRSEALGTMSLRQLKAKVRDFYAVKEGKKHDGAKRLPLEEVNDNASSDC